MMDIYSLLRFEEGERLRPYRCSAGYITVGVGHKLSNDKSALPTDFPVITHEQSRFLLEQDVLEAQNGLWQHPETRLIMKQCNDARLAIVTSMAFQLGLNGLLGFKKTIQLLRDEDYQLASIEMLGSKWAKEDSPSRAKRHSKVILSGDWNAYTNLL